MTLAAPQQSTRNVAALSIRGLRKTFQSQVALAGVDFTVNPGEVHALLGENGSGKSTLIKVLSGFHRPDPGSAVAIAGESLPFGNPAAGRRLGARFVHQDLGLVSTSSVADNLYLGSSFPTTFGTIRTRSHRLAATQALAAAGLDIDPRVLVSALSPAQRTAVAVARALLTESDAPVRLLVLDEPTAALPDNEVHHLLATIRTVASQGIGIIYVTHRIDEIFDIAQRVSVLRDGSVVAERDVVGLTRPQLVTLLVGEEFAAVERAAEKLPADAGPTILSVRDLAADRIEDLSFDTAGECVTGIAGITGSGRDTVLGAVYGAVNRTAGTVLIAGHSVSPLRTRQAVAAGCAFVPADRKTQGGILSMTARENLTLPDLKSFRRQFTLIRSRETAETRRWFERLSVRPRDGSELALAKLSGGNQQKVLIAKWLRRKPSLLLIDEPTQGVDLAAKAEIHGQLLTAAQNGASVVVSCSDPDELAALCQRVLVLRRGRIVADLTGSEVTAERVSRLSHDSLDDEEPR